MSQRHRMHTYFTDDPVEAAKFISSDKLVVFPTETVYGLGGNALNAAAVESIYEAKGRPSSNPLIVHVGAIADLSRVVEEITPSAHAFMDAFFPGPITLVLPRHPSLPKVVSGGLDTVAIRMPSLPIALQLLRSAGLPIAAPSANISGRPSATTWQSAAEDLDGRVSCILRGPKATVGLESTVVDCTGRSPILLRPGAISVGSLSAIVPEISTDAPDIFRSPGLRHHHYAPSARVCVISTPDEAIPGDQTGYIGLAPPHADAQFKQCVVASHVKDYSHRLFEFFRDCDRSGVTTIYCQSLVETGLAHALMDRIRRAAKASR
ncbi:MAG: L-threonylcarbamoyladenylate synthase [Bacteroidetes bacterium]|nr:L-threonylcarbamoyladenylate synthase [Bacteroidota bacterium]